MAKNKKENATLKMLGPVFTEFLEKHCEKEPEFRHKYENPKKSMKDCVQYVINQVKESGSEGFPDRVIYGMVLHYYDEEQIDIGKAIDVKVKVNRFIEITDEEKEELRSKAKREIIEDEKKRIRDRDKAKREKLKKARKPEQAHSMLPEESRKKVQDKNDKKFAKEQAEKPNSNQGSLF